METIARWWASDSTERYWLEVSDRGSDLGADLNAPASNETGGAFWSYDLLREVEDGDIVLHYDRPEHAIVAWSQAVGVAWPDQVVWAARGMLARSRGIRPHERDGWRVSLNGPFRLGVPLTLSAIRGQQSALEAIRGTRRYFPFELGRRETRPMQGYLFKLPAAFVELFPELHEVPRSDAVAPFEVALPHAPPGPAGASERPVFVPRNEDVRSRQAAPWSRDPSEVDRALSAHARVERLVAEEAAAEGWSARSYGRGDPVFDLLLEAPGANVRVVVEVKSTTSANEEKQLRLALGQVLRYRQLMTADSVRVGAWVAIERPPRDGSWRELLAGLGVSLVWPAIVREQLREAAGAVRGSGERRGA